jgi:hypothetical protein
MDDRSSREIDLFTDLRNPTVEHIPKLDQLFQPRESPKRASRMLVNMSPIFYASMQIQ